MLIILSPAKIQNTSPHQAVDPYTQPQFAGEAEILVHHIRQYSVIALSKLLEINLKLAQLNAYDFQNGTCPSLPKMPKKLYSFSTGKSFMGWTPKP